MAPEKETYLYDEKSHDLRDSWKNMNVKRAMENIETEQCA